MAQIITMPALSPTMESGSIAAWLKKEDEALAAGEVLAEIETDKATAEFEFLEDGYLRRILLAPGIEVPVGTPIAIFAEDLEEDIAPLLEQANEALKGVPSSAVTPPAAEEVTPPPAERSAAPPPAPAPAPSQPPAQAETPVLPGDGDGRVRISPFARKLAEQGGVDWQRLRGTGPGGRIVARDIEEQVERPSASPSPSLLPAAAAATMIQPALEPATPPRVPNGVRPLIVAAEGGAAYVEVPLSLMRRTIARRMAESKQRVPHFQVTRKVRAERLLAFREQLLALEAGVKVTINDVLVKCCASALMAHPVVNSQFAETHVRRFQQADIAIAVGSDEGLITPIIRSAQAKGIATIARESKTLAEQARARKLAPESYQGGTFTISNLGMFGIDTFNAIINPPQAAILAVAAVVSEPVVDAKGKLAAGKTLSLTLSCDHRVIDGVAAAAFMATLTQCIESPMRLLL